jgi:hypothetical protein
MVFGRMARSLPIAALVVLGTGGAALPRAPGQAVLAKIERGQWLLRDRAGAERKLCLTTATRLVQIEHGGAACQQVVLAQDPRSATLRYSCPGHGQGRTVITVETPRLVRIETQGVIDGEPFEQEYEARKLGPCG